MPSISFFNDGNEYTLRDKGRLRLWLYSLAKNEGIEIDSVNVVLTTDDKLKEINSKFLKHDFYTDIITFQYETNVISGEIFISLERVKENARDERHSVKDELHRVIVHGFLHMCGYKDKSEADKKEMRAREDFYLTLRKF